MKKYDVVERIFHRKLPENPIQEKGLAFAPTNVALCKYWGKRDPELNLPVTSSLSVALPDKGALSAVALNDEDTIILNDKPIPADSDFAKRVIVFLDLFRPKKNWHLKLDIKMNLPVSAGFASSACGFAALTFALNDLFGWQLRKKDLSILARLGSGSAARSLWLGFVEWHAGVHPNGMDSYAEPLPFEWPELRVGLLTVSAKPKAISSREAMQHTTSTSVLYSAWPKKVLQDLIIIKQALHTQKFALLGGASESNALNMHATILGSWPPICYFQPETIAAMHKIWQLRRDGLELYFTEDAGPNLKLLFLEHDQQQVLAEFPGLEVIKVFET